MEDIALTRKKEDVRQAPEYGRFMEQIGWEVETLGEDQQIFIRKIGPVSIAKIQRPNKMIEVEKMMEIIAKKRVFMCKFEPYEELVDKVRHLGFKLDNWPLLASKTRVVDLSQTEENIYKSFDKDARYCIRKAQEAEYKVKKNEFEKFYEIWRKANKIKRLWTPAKKDFMALVRSFGNRCFCVILNDLGGCLVLLYKKTAYYFYSGTLPEGKKMNLPYGIVWEAMREAKRREAVVWDFEGVLDARWPNADWKGFSHFKKSFGGEEIVFPGCFSKWRWPF